MTDKLTFGRTTSLPMDDAELNQWALEVGRAILNMGTVERVLIDYISRVTGDAEKAGRSANAPLERRVRMLERELQRDRSVPAEMRAEVRRALNAAREADKQRDMVAHSALVFRPAHGFGVATIPGLHVIKRTPKGPKAVRRDLAWLKDTAQKANEAAKAIELSVTAWVLHRRGRSEQSREKGPSA